MSPRGQRLVRPQVYGVQQGAESGIKAEGPGVQGRDDKRINFDDAFDTYVNSGGIEGVDRPEFRRFWQ